MIKVKSEICEGCGTCVQVCPSGALLLQNGVACWDAELCEGCGLCVDACPQNAILLQEPQPVGVDVIHIPAERPAERLLVSQPQAVSVRGSILPAVGTFLLWTGREILPRLADMALNYVDRRIQPTDTGLHYEATQFANRGSGARNRRRRPRRNRRRQFRDK